MSQSIAGLENKRFFGAANVINKNKHFNDQFKDLISYEVVQGDTLTSIAFKHKVSLRFLMNLNHLLNDIVIPGETLYIPILEDVLIVDKLNS